MHNPGKRKKKHHHDEHMDESWLIPYADLLTLLLALFIILFAMGKIDEQKAAQLSSSLYAAFHGGSGVMKYENPVKNTVKTTNTTQNEIRTKDNNNPDNQTKEMIEASQNYQAETEQLEELAQKLTKYMKDNNLTGQLQTVVSEAGLKITINEKALFNSGKADLLPASRDLAIKISQLLEGIDSRDITISGFTDNVPMKNAVFKSNWDLSTMRAVNFLEVVLENRKLDPSNFKATGYGEYQPIADNRTAEGRAKNRRVEITIDRLYTKTQ